MSSFLNACGSDGMSLSLAVFLCAPKEEYSCERALLISGTSANHQHFQVFLLDGICRWNQDRAAAAVAGGNTDPPTYSGLLREATNQLSLSVLGTMLHPLFRAPRQYTGNKRRQKLLFYCFKVLLFRYKMLRILISTFLLN